MEIKFEIKKPLGVLGQCSDNIQQIEVNIITYKNGKIERLDIRKWIKDGHKMGKGISLTIEQGKALCDTLNAFYEGSDNGKSG